MYWFKSGRSSPLRNHLMVCCGLEVLPTVCQHRPSWQKQASFLQNKLLSSLLLALVLWGHFCSEPGITPKRESRTLHVPVLLSIRWGQGVWDRSGSAGAWPNPPLHEIPWRSWNRPAAHVSACGTEGDLWEETLSPCKHLPSMSPFLCSRHHPLFCLHRPLAL